MTATYFFPETTFDHIARISDWEPGYVVWPFNFWLWMLDQGIKIEDYDLIDLAAWAQKGGQGLEESVAAVDFSYYLENTKDLDVYSTTIQKILNHTNFSYHRRRPVFSDLEKAFWAGAVCEVVLDPDILDGSEGHRTHRVVVLEITAEDVIFHDPRKINPVPARKEKRELFKKAWLSLAEPELCVYKK